MPRTGRVENVRVGARYRRGEALREVHEVTRHTVKYRVIHKHPKGPGRPGDYRTVARATWSIWMKEAKLHVPAQG